MQGFSFKYKAFRSDKPAPLNTSTAACMMHSGVRGLVSMQSVATNNLS